jgi:hypothetical protein
MRSRWPLIAAVYIGFAVADGRPRVIAETVVAAAFVVVAAAGVTRPAWLLVEPDESRTIGALTGAFIWARGAATSTLWGHAVTRR